MKWLKRVLFTFVLLIIVSAGVLTWRFQVEKARAKAEAEPILRLIEDRRAARAEAFAAYIESRVTDGTPDSNLASLLKPWTESIHRVPRDAIQAYATEWSDPYGEARRLSEAWYDIAQATGSMTELEESLNPFTNDSDTWEDNLCAFLLKSPEIIEILRAFESGPPDAAPAGTVADNGLAHQSSKFLFQLLRARARAAVTSENTDEVVRAFEAARMHHQWNRLQFLFEMDSYWSYFRITEGLRLMPILWAMGDAGMMHDGVLSRFADAWTTAYDPKLLELWALRDVYFHDWYLYPGEQLVPTTFLIRLKDGNFEPDMRDTGHSLAAIVNQPPHRTRDSISQIVSQSQPSTTFASMIIQQYLETYEAFYDLRAAAPAMKTAQALFAYKAEHGSYPEKLDVLYGYGLDELPLDPRTGDLMAYERAGPGFLLFLPGNNQHREDPVTLWQAQR